VRGEPEYPICGVMLELKSSTYAPVIEKILKHLKLWQVEHPGKPPPESNLGDMIKYHHPMMVGRL